MIEDEEMESYLCTLVTKKLLGEKKKWK